MASTSEAPVKVGAPHMSMIEPVAFMCVNLGMFVAEASNFQFGPLKWLVQCMQPILFDRFDAGTLLRASQSSSSLPALHVTTVKIYLSGTHA